MPISPENPPVLDADICIKWDDDDRCYLVHIPAYPEQRWRTHGDTYTEAAEKGYEVLQMLRDDDENA